MVCLVAALVELPMRRGLGAERDSVVAAGLGKQDVVAYGS